MGLRRTLLAVLLIPLALQQDWKEDLLAEADRLEGLIETRAAAELLEAVEELPPVEETTLWYAATGGYLAEAYTAREREDLPEAERDGLRSLTVDARRYYQSFYGSPLAALRAFDLAAARGIESFEGKRVLDFGFGSIGQLRLLESVGAHAVGTEVMPRLRAMYADAQDSTNRTEGSLRLVFEPWPASAASRERVGGDFDLFVSKNTLKRGYLRPQGELDPRLAVDLGVPLGDWLAALNAALKPGGLALFYNLGTDPGPDPAKAHPATDIACPWTREELVAAGFEVLAHDEDDSDMAREFGHALGWDAGSSGMDLEGLFARYTLLRRLH